MSDADSEEEGAVAPPRVVAPLQLRGTLPTLTNHSSPEGDTSKQPNAFDNFKFRQSDAAARGSKHAPPSRSSGVTNGSGPAGARQHAGSKRSAAVLEDSPQGSPRPPVSTQSGVSKQESGRGAPGRLGGLSSGLPTKRASTAVPPPKRRQLQIMVSDEEEEEEGNELPAQAPALAAAAKAASPPIELPETPPLRSNVVDLTADDAVVAETVERSAQPACVSLVTPKQHRQPPQPPPPSEQQHRSGKPAKLSPVEKCEEIAARIRAALEDQFRGATSADDPNSPAPTTPGGSAVPVMLPEPRSGRDSSLAVVALPEVVAACGQGSAADMLKPYQLVGLNWMLLLKRLSVGGCILADEMGLGKTASAICFLGLLKAVEKDPGPHLVVVPASLLENWQRELKRWCPALEVRTYHGKQRVEVSEEWDHWRREQAALVPGEARSPPPFDVMVTSYVYFERDSVEQRSDRKFFRRVQKHPTHPWSHMVLDEAHAIKARAAQRTQRLQALASGCKRRVFLTGTPLQNDLGELKSLLSFLLPDVFGPDSQQMDNLEEEDEGEEEAAERMRALLEPFLLRRLKSDVATQLAAKTQQVRRVEMTDTQAKLYRAEIERFRAEARPDAPTPSSISDVVEASEGQPPAPPEAAPALKSLGTKRVSNIFVQLRKIAQHPLLIRSLYSDDTVASMATICRKRGDFGAEASQAQVEAELAGYSDHALHALCAASSNKDLRALQLQPDQMRTSGKFGVLAGLLPELQGAASRPLIFSQWTAVLDLLEWLLQDLGLRYVRLDGSTAVAERLTIVDSFNKDPAIFAFLLSTRAGGQGLNLVGADTVILHDVDFNPQIDRQAEDRSHRLGQERPVTIYRLITSGTVDQKINDIAQRKLALDAAVLTGIGGTAGAAEERRVAASILEDILNEKTQA